VWRSTELACLIATRRSLVDDARYRREDDRNHLVLIRVVGARRQGDGVVDARSADGVKSRYRTLKRSFG
jgi:hypothetical protein